MGRIRRFATPEDLGQAVAEDIAARIATKSGRFLLGCPGGRSPKPVYRALAGLFAQNGADLSDLIIVMMDDYVLKTDSGFVPVADTAHFSCRRFACIDIQDLLNAGLPEARRIRSQNVWVPDPGNPAAYDAQLRAAGGIDYFLLASGAGDGHVAFNPPGSSPDSASRIVTLAAQTRADNLRTFPDFANLHEVPHHGVTVGIATIARMSRAVGMVVWGKDKATAFRHLAGATGYDPAWPATVWATVADATLYADHAAAPGD